MKTAIAVAIAIVIVAQYQIDLMEKAYTRSVVGVAGSFFVNLILFSVSSCDSMVSISSSDRGYFCCTSFTNALVVSGFWVFTVSIIKSRISLVIGWLAICTAYS